MYKLTHPQKRIIVNQQIYENSKFAYMYGFVKVNDQRVELIKKAINEAIKYFDALRLRFTQRKGEILQYFTPYQYEEIPIKDQGYDFSEEVFQLFDNKLYRFFIVKKADVITGYYFIFHHAIIDAYSVTLITKYIEDVLLNREIDHHQQSYLDFVDLERAYLKSNQYIKDTDFFCSLLKTATSLNYVANFDLETRRVSLSFLTSETKEILNFCKSNKTSVFKFFMSVTFLYLYLTNNKTTQTIATTHHNRLSDQLLKTAGMMVGTIPVVQTISLDKSFKEFLIDSINNITTSLEKPLFPIDNLILNLNKNNTFDLNITEIIFNSIPFSNNYYPIKRFSPNQDVAKLNFKLNPHSKPKGSNLEIAVDYRVSDYTEEEAIAILNKIKELASLFINHQDEKMSSFINEPTDILDLIDYSNKQLLALTSKTIQFTYQELDYYSNAVADAIDKAKLTNNQVIGIVNYRSPWFVIALLGVFKAGKTAITIDPRNPLNRLKAIIKEVKLDCLLIFDDPLVADEDLCQINIAKLKPLEEYLSKVNDVAYIIFTSGTTGDPKGVLVSRIAFTYFINNIKNEYYNFKKERFLGYCDFNFDVSMLEIMLSLVTNSTLYVAAEDERHNLNILQKVINDTQINHVFFPTKIGELFIKNYPKSNLSTLMVAGEELQYYQATTYQVLNGYGPTEFTILSHIACINKEAHVYPIGQPLPGTKCLINLKAVEPASNIKGELYLVGPQRALGYLNDYGLTNEKFIKLAGGEVAYKTGDIISFENGIYYFITRNDRQIKYHGYRIELSEIESIALQSKMINSARALNDANGLILAIVTTDSYEEELFKKYLTDNLPSYSVPKSIMVFDELPLKTNGKINDQLLLLNNRQKHVKETLGSIDILTPTMRILIKIFKKYARIKAINIYENYLNLNLDSLDFIQISMEIENKTKVVVNFSDFFCYPSINELAKFLDEKQRLDNVIEIRKGVGVPLVIIFDYSFDIISYRDLLATIDQDIPIIGIVDKDIPSTESLEEYVETIISKLKRYNSFDLVGYSSGGIIALEITRQLPRNVNNIYLIDTPNYYRYHHQINNLPTLLTKNVFSIIALYKVGAALRYGINKLKSLVKGKSLFSEQKQLRKMILKYRVDKIQHPVIIFKSSVLMNKTDNNLGWQNEFANVSAYQFKANHITIMKKKNVIKICQIIESRRKNEITI